MVHIAFCAASEFGLVAKGVAISSLKSPSCALLLLGEPCDHHRHHASSRHGNSVRCSVLALGVGYDSVGNVHAHNEPSYAGALSWCKQSFCF